MNCPTILPQLLRTVQKLTYMGVRSPRYALITGRWFTSLALLDNHV